MKILFTFETQNVSKHFSFCQPKHFLDSLTSYLEFKLDFLTTLTTVLKVVNCDKYNPRSYTNTSIESVTAKVPILNIMD